MAIHNPTALVDGRLASVTTNSPRCLHIVSMTHGPCFLGSTVGHPPPCAQTSRLITLRIHALPPPVPSVHQYDRISRAVSLVWSELNFRLSRKTGRTFCSLRQAFLAERQEEPFVP
jgi:hypothetical protein